ncbi:MAG: PAS domain S-box protein [Bacteroidota bacterium]
MTSKKESKHSRRNSASHFSTIYNQLFTQSVANIILLDRDYTFIRVSESYAANFGMHADEFVGRRHSDFFIDDKKSDTHFAQVLDEVVRTKKTMRLSNLPVKFADKPDNYWDPMIQPIFDAHGEVEFLFFIAFKVTEGKCTEESLQRLNRELRAISNCNQTLLRATEEQSLLKNICQIICNEAGYRMAWVGYVENDETRTIRPVAWAGAEDGYLSVTNISWSETVDVGCTAGIAIRTGKSASIQDFAAQPASAVWRNEAVQRGYRSCVSLPLKDENENSFGVLTIYSSDADVFTNKEIRLLEELSGDLAFGITVLRSRIIRKQSEQELQKTNSFLSALIESVPAAVIGLDLEGKVHSVWNPAAERMLGWKAEEVMGHFLPTVSLDKKEEFRQFRESIRQGKVLNGVDVQRQKKDGSLIDYSIFASPLLDEKGQVFGNVAVMVDITERKRADKILRQAHQKYESLVNSVDGVVWEADAQTFVFTFVSNQVERFLGYPKERWLTEPTFWKDHIHPADQELAVNFCCNATQEKRSHEFDYRMIAADGRVVWVHDIVTVIVENDRPISLRGIMVDITARKQTEQALAAKELKLRNLAESSPGLMGTFYLRPDGSVCMPYTSPQIQNLFGLRSEDVVDDATPLLKRTHPDDAKRVGDAIAESARTMTPWHCEYRVLHPTRGELWLEGSSYPKLHPQGGILWYGFVHDITVRKQAEDALRQSEERFRRLTENARDVIYRMTLPDGKYEYVSPAAYSMLGHYPEEYYADTQLFKQAIHPRWRKYFETEFENLLKGEVSPTYEYQFIHPTGKVLWLNQRNILIRDAAEKPIALEGIVTDITERKRMEEVLRESEWRYREIFDHVLDALYLLEVTEDGRFRTIEVNPALERSTGIPRSVSVGKTQEEIVPAEVAAVVNAKYRRCIDIGQPIEEELELTLPAGKRHYHSTLIPARDEHGRIYRIVGISRDITERKQTEAKLKESEERYRLIAENTADTISVYNLDLTLIYISPSVFKLRGFSVQEAMKQSLSDVLTPDSLQKVKSVFAEQMEQELGGHTDSTRTVLLELEEYCKDCSTIWIELSAAFLRDNNQKPVGVLTVTRDITKRKQAEAELKQTEEKRRQLEMELIQAQKLESLGTLASGVAHDFNNILGIILGYSTMLESQFIGSGETSEKLCRVKQAAVRGASLVKQLLTFARKGESIFQSISINTIIEELSKMLYETFPKTIPVTIDLKTEIPMIVADASQIHQVLLNLCVNARDAMPNGGTLAIATSTVEHNMLVQEFPQAAARQYILVEVSDDGVGMNEETKRRIFEPFYTTKGPGQGTGLGLALVYSIVTSHQGMIAVDSAPGEGTTFRIYIPVEENVVGTPSTVEGEWKKIPGGTETVLIIEDEIPLAELVKHILMEKGYSVLTAYDGEIGVLMYTQHCNDIAVVLSDFGLPKFSGDEVFRRIRMINPNAKVIIFSGFIEPDTKAKLREAGVAQIFQKPYHLSSVLRIVREVIDGNR